MRRVFYFFSAIQFVLRFSINIRLHLRTQTEVYIRLGLRPRLMGESRRNTTGYGTHISYISIQQHINIRYFQWNDISK